MIYTFSFQGTIPSKKNSKRIFYKNGRPIVLSSKNHDDWHDVASYVCIREKIKQGINIPLSHVQSMTIIFHVKTKRRFDLTNRAQSIEDLLVDCGVLEDDNWKVVPEIVLRMRESDKDGAIVEICV